MISAACLDVAKAVLDRCMVDNVTPEDKNIMNTNDYKVEFNYEFLDDYRDVPFKERCRRRVPCCFPKDTDEYDETFKNFAFSDLTSAADDGIDEFTDGKGFVATWGPPGFSTVNHPLRLMVRYVHTHSSRQLKCVYVMITVVFTGIIM